MGRGTRFYQKLGNSNERGLFGLYRRVWNRLLRGTELTTCCLLLLPLGQPDAWQNVEFKNIPPNEIEFATDSLTFHVQESASGCLASFTHEISVSGLNVRGYVEGDWRDIDGNSAGEGDDMILRVGLVEAGSRHLKFFEKRFAPEWLRQLFRVKPEGAGVGRILFLNVAPEEQRDQRTSFRERKFVLERVVASPDKNGNFEFNYKFFRPVAVIGVWLSADGDDSESSFAVTVERVELTRAKE